MRHVGVECWTRRYLVLLWLVSSLKQDRQYT